MKKTCTGTQYKYDPNGYYVHMVTPKGYEKEWQYDALRNLCVNRIHFGLIFKRVKSSIQTMKFALIQMKMQSL
ncbi:MAG: hypothetical protein OSJ61_16935 [Lachnospiraceae bacterium]|nr:hypothetical protein [Lachnospiraceae bacterium]